MKAVVSIGCCYNLLSEIGCENGDFNCGFPISKGINYMGVSLGKNARDLACQVCDRLLSSSFLCNMVEMVHNSKNIWRLPLCPWSSSFF